MTLLEKLQKTREDRHKELKALHAEHPSGDLPADAQTRWNTLSTEIGQLKAAETRQAFVDKLDREAPGQSIGGDDRSFEAERRSFSVVKAIGGAARLPGVDDGREREISKELARRSGRSFEGVAIPLQALAPETRVLTTTNPSGGPGSNLIATELLAPQDHLRPNLVIRQLGATVLSGLTGNVAIPRVKTDPVAYWVAENVALTPSDPQFDQVTLSPKHAGGIVEFSRNMLLQSSPDIEALVRGLLAKVLAQALDIAAISGSGSGAVPRGILNTTGIGSVAAGTNGGALTYDMVADLVGQVADANAETGSLAFLTNTKQRRAAAKLKDTAGNPLGLSTIFEGIPVRFTNNVPGNFTKGTGTNLSALIYGNWSDLLIGLWSEIDVLVNPYESTAYPKGNVQVRAIMTCDIAVRHPESFAAITDLT